MLPSCTRSEFVFERPEVCRPTVEATRNCYAALLGCGLTYVVERVVALSSAKVDSEANPVRDFYTKEDFELAEQGVCLGPNLEFFVVDRNGFLGAFTNAGLAPVPAGVFSSFEEFLKAHEAIDRLPPAGGAIWVRAKPPIFKEPERRARCGLFVYDWDYFVSQPDPARPYLLQCRPEKPLHVSFLPAEVREYLTRTLGLDISFPKGCAVLITREP